MKRIPMALGLAVIAVVLVWAGYQVLATGRDVMAQEARFSVEYFLGSHLLWMLSGALVAAIPQLGSRVSAERSATPALVAAVIPIAMLLPVYLWTSSIAPRLLLQEWLLSTETQAALAVIGGMLVGTALCWRLFR